MHDTTMQLKAFLSPWSCDYPVVKVVGEVLLVLLNERGELMHHHPLEEWRRVFQSEIDHPQYVSSIYCLEGCLVLIFQLYVVVFVPPPNIHLSEDFLALQFLEFCPDIQQRAIILDRPLV